MHEHTKTPVVESTKGPFTYGRLALRDGTDR